MHTFAPPSEAGRLENTLVQKNGFENTALLTVQKTARIIQRTLETVPSPHRCTLIPGIGRFPIAARSSGAGGFKVTNGTMQTGGAFAQEGGFRHFALIEGFKIYTRVPPG